ncbi:putative di-trans,poly-cis-decaprenylcistransferase [Trichuris suis]|nr:putative di-trans,poly-cis-decaprenylcistransferase [Trichuris suis]
MNGKPRNSKLFANTELTWWQRFLSKLLQMGPIPNHVAFIMDGNRRYARRKGVRSELGHEFGFEALAMALKWCNHVGIREVTVFAFSIENFKRSEAEVAVLMSIARRKFADLIVELGDLMGQGVCIRFFGNTALLPKDIQKLMADILLKTRHNNKLFLNVCVAYTARDEFTRAVKVIEDAVRAKTLQIELVTIRCVMLVYCNEESKMFRDISEYLMHRILDSGDSSNPDLVIRTSGETRLSDFMMIQVLLKVDEGPLRRRAVEMLWMAHFRGLDVFWLNHLPENCMPLISKLTHRSSCESLHLDITKLSELDGYVIAGFVSVAPVAQLSSTSNGTLLHSLYIDLCDAALGILPSDNFGILMAIECCLLRAFKKRPEGLNSFRQFVCSENASKKLRNIVRCCWDSEFVGVADLSVRMFELWLEANFYINEFGASALRRKLLSHYLNEYPWFYRGRYRIIASLMNRCTADEIVEVHNQLYDCWKVCMNCAQIAPLASKLWQIALKRCGDRLDLWLPMLGQLLLKPGEKTCSLIGRHWLPMVNDITHHSFQVVIDQFRLRLTEVKRQWTPSIKITLLSNLHDIGGSERDVKSSLNQLYKAASVVLKQYFNTAQWQGDHLKANWDLLEEIGRCAEESARIVYFEVLCRHSPKEVMSNGWHRDRVHQFLLTNLTVPSQSFRLSVMSSYRHYLAKMERIGSPDDAWLCHFMDAVLSQMFPGANFQRYVSSLNLLLVALESSSRFKALWNERFEENVVWSAQARSTLVRCILHSCADIRQLAIRIATEFCSYRFVDGLEMVQFYMRIAFDLIDRSQLSECDVGVSLLICLLSSVDEFQKRNVEGENTARANALKLSILSKLVFPMLGILLQRSNDGSIPHVYGRLGACSRLWHHIQDALSADFVLQLINAIVELILEILRRLGSNDNSACPTLPEMHSSVGVELGQNDTLLPIELKAILWNVTEGCGLLVQFAERLIEEKCCTELHSIRDLFFQVMTRNRSVIIHDECEKHLISFCTLCLKASWKVANSVVMELTERTLSNIEYAPPVSALRRAGGYPFLLNCLVCTASTFKERQILSYALERLMQICHGELESLSVTESTEDSPLLRALHCLRMIVRSSECHEGCRPFLAKLFQLAIHHLNSPIWSIRNAVSMLLAEIIRALFVRSSIQKGTMGDPWAQDVLQFWTCHGDIWQHCVQLIVSIADSIKDRPFESRIHPLLIVFQNVLVDDAPIAHMPVKVDLRQCRLALTKILVHSPEWSVRRLAAEALSNLIPPRHRRFVARRIQRLLPRLRTTLNLYDAAAKLVDALKFPLNVLADQNSSTCIERQEDISELCKLLAFGVDMDLTASHLRERLVECCSGACGRSMQALALPVFTKLMMHSQNDLFSEWSGFVVRFAADATSERLRYAAAVSLALAGKLVIKFVHDSECHVDLLMAVFSLLQDDIGYIREAASQISIFCDDDSRVPLACSECIRAVLSCVVGQQAAIALADRLLDELLPDVNFAFPIEQRNVSPTDCIHYAEKYTILLAYYNFLNKFALLHPVSFDRLLNSKLATDDRKVAMDSRLSENVSRFFENDFYMCSLQLTSELFEAIVRLCLTCRLLKRSRCDSYLGRILPAVDRLDFLICAEKEPNL